MNDPFESEPISVSIIFDDPADADRQFPRAAMFEEASDLLCDRCRLSSFTRSGPYDYGPVGFGDGFARARMWAQYAQNHSGVCLAFDQRALRDAARKSAAARGLELYEAPITYRTEGGLERPVALPYSRASDDMPGLIADIFPVVVGHLYFSKAWDWSTETEYRFLMHGDVNEHEYIDVRGALTGIFCGPKLPNAHLRDVVSRSLRANASWPGVPAWVEERRDSSHTGPCIPCEPGSRVAHSGRTRGTPCGLVGIGAGAGGRAQARAEERSHRPPRDTRFERRAGERGGSFPPSKS